VARASKGPAIISIATGTKPVIVEGTFRRAPRKVRSFPRDPRHRGHLLNINQVFSYDRPGQGWPFEFGKKLMGVESVWPAQCWPPNGRLCFSCFRDNGIEAWVLNHTISPFRRMGLNCGKVSSPASASFVKNETCGPQWVDFGRAFKPHAIWLDCAFANRGR